MSIHVLVLLMCANCLQLIACGPTVYDNATETEQTTWTDTCKQSCRNFLGKIKKNCKLCIDVLCTKYNSDNDCGNLDISKYLNKDPSISQITRFAQECVDKKILDARTCVNRLDLIDKRYLDFNTAVRVSDCILLAENPKEPRQWLILEDKAKKDSSLTGLYNRCSCSRVVELGKFYQKYCPIYNPADLENTDQSVTEYPDNHFQENYQDYHSEDFIHFLKYVCYLNKMPVLLAVTLEHLTDYISSISVASDNQCKLSQIMLKVLDLEMIFIEKEQYTGKIVQIDNDYLLEHGILRRRPTNI